MGEDDPFDWVVDRVYDRSAPHPSGETVVVEAPRPLTESVLWARQRAFFERLGAAAWTVGAVPQYATTNRVIADQCAQVLMGWFRDLRDSRAPRGGPEEPITILELGAGSGRFAFHLITRLTELLAGSDLADVVWRYRMTDVAPAAVAAWHEHPGLRPLLVSRVDVAVHDASSVGPVPSISGDPIPSAAPLAVIANYVFGSLAPDCFAIGTDGVLREAQLGVERRGEVDGGAEVLDGLRLRGSWRVADTPADPVVADLLRDHRDRLRPGSAFTIPVAAVRTIEHLRALAGDEVLMLVADAGPTQLEQLQGAALPRFVSHGSFSLPVNLHALATATERAGGRAFVASRPQPHLEVVALRHGPGAHVPSATEAAFRRAIDEQGPARFLQLEHALHLAFADLTFEQLTAAIHWALLDDVVFAQAVPALTRLLDDGATAAQRSELRQLTAAVGARRFVSVGDDEIAAAIRRVDAALDAAT